MFCFLAYFLAFVHNLFHLIWVFQSFNLSFTCVDDIYYLSEWYFGALSAEVEVPDVVAPQIDIFLYPFAHFESMRW